MPSEDELRTLPGIGPRMSEDLRTLGVRSVADLRGRDPADMYRRLCALTGVRQDPCVLYVFRCAVYVAETSDSEVDLRRWWSWKDRRHANESGPDPITGARDAPARGA